MNKGIVLGVFSKPYGTITLWSFKLEGDDTFWRCARDKPEVTKGQYIEFEADENKNVNVDSIKVVSSKSVPDNASTARTPAPPSQSGDVGDRIRYQAARRDASRIVTTAMQTDHLPMAANTAKGKRLDLVVGYIEQVTKQLLEQEENNS